MKSIEEELCGAMGLALGKQGEKIQAAVRVMDEERRRYGELLLLESSSEDRDDQQLVAVALRHNEARKRALKARWELLVHRQAVGFIMDNHRVVHSTFPIGEALPETRTAERDDDGNDAEANDGATSKKKVFGDQLDWWQRVGRWR